MRPSVNPSSRYFGIEANKVILAALLKDKVKGDVKSEQKHESSKSLGARSSSRYA